MDPSDVRINVTKDLAKKLGFVEIIRIQSPKESQKLLSAGLKSKDQEFEYLIIIDFESTCWEERSGGGKSPEIIEFPAVLMNVKTGIIEEEFQQYVMPVENKILSSFCTKFTGIKQEQVDNGVPLGTCLLLFNKWLDKVSESRKMVFHKKQNGKQSCTFVTWSDWDLSVCLHNECRRKKIRKPDILCQWIDLKATYKAFYKRQPKGLRGALSEVELQFEGREHSGLCDAKNTARLVWHMVQHGAVLKITKVLLQLKKTSSPTKSTSLLGLTSTPKRNIPKKNIRNTTCTLVADWLKVRKPLHKLNTPIMQNRRKEASPLMNCNTGNKHVVQKENELYTKPQNPQLKRIQNEGIDMGNKTPEAAHKYTSVGFKRTPPLCNCGRRASRRCASLPGPNQGQYFFSCPKKRSLGMVHKSGCNYFKWEN